ncbi:MAG TPA: hypothetical protein VFI33_09390, partial [Puia sp.]|nr:hypothetical protein [Puia sp.]
METIQSKFKGLRQNARSAVANGNNLKAQLLYSEACYKCLRYKELNSEFHDVNIEAIEFFISKEKYKIGLDFLEMGYRNTNDPSVMNAYKVLFSIIGSTEEGGNQINLVTPKEPPDISVNESFVTDLIEANGHYGLYLMRNDQIDKSEKYFKKAIDLSEIADNPNAKLDWLSQISVLYSRQHRHSLAWRVLIECFSLSFKLRQEIKIFKLVKLGEFLAFESFQFHQFAEKAIEVAGSIKDKVLRANIILIAFRSYHNASSWQTILELSDVYLPELYENFGSCDYTVEIEERRDMASEKSLLTEE